MDKILIGEWSEEMRLSMTHFVAAVQEAKLKNPKRTYAEWMALFLLYNARNKEAEVAPSKDSLAEVEVMVGALARLKPA